MEGSCERLQGVCLKSTGFRCLAVCVWFSDGCNSDVVPTGTCPADKAWVDVPTAASVAHALAECSNQGVCDRATGKCICFEGFEGDGCQRCGLSLVFCKFCGATFWCSP
jgi:hypothetical protein